MRLVTPIRRPAAALLGTRKTVTFSSTATIDSTALSGRYSRVGG